MTLSRIIDHPSYGLHVALAIGLPVSKTSAIADNTVVHGLGRPTHGLSWVGSRFLAFWWVGLGRGSETFPQIIKLVRSLVTAEVIPDNLIMINTDK